MAQNPQEHKCREARMTEVKHEESLEKCYSMRKSQGKTKNQFNYSRRIKSFAPDI